MSKFLNPAETWEFKTTARWADLTIAPPSHYGIFSIGHDNEAAYQRWRRSWMTPMQLLHGDTRRRLMRERRRVANIPTTGAGNGQNIDH